MQFFREAPLLTGHGSATLPMEEAEVQALPAQALALQPLDGKRVLVLLPDGTRSAPVPLFFRLLNELLGPRVARLDFLIALGTHPPMSEEAIARLVGLSAAQRRALYPHVEIFNHRWDDPAALVTVGVITRDESQRLTDGLLCEEVPVTLNRLVLDYDQIIICGPVFPHEVAGFSGGAKYLFPGIAGPDIINFTHWLGALATSLQTIGIKQTPTRRVIHRAAEFVDKPILCLALVMQGHTLHGLYVGAHAEAWNAAADLSAQINIIRLPRPMERVLAMPPAMYDDLWTAAKAMYKTEPVVADGGEVIIFAPHLAEISFAHGRLIDEVGYHVRDYFLKQPGRFDHIPGGILAHSTHVKGAGSYDAASGIERPRIRVTLASAIPEEDCRRVNLGFADFRTIDPAAWVGREADGILLVPRAGEVLYRLGAPHVAA